MLPLDPPLTTLGAAWRALWWLPPPLLAALVLAAGWRRRLAQRRSFAALAQRLGLRLQEDRRGASGALAGREVRVWSEQDAEAGGCVTCVRLELCGVQPPQLSLEPGRLHAWLSEGAAPGASPFDPQVAALLGAPAVQPQLAAFLRANRVTSFEAGALCARRAAPLRSVRELEGYVEEALALAIALSSATHGLRLAGGAQG